MPAARSIDHRLLDTAIDQFGRKGLEGASTRDIATAAGTTMSSITYHYGSKEGLYLAAARHIANQIGELMAPALAESRKLGRRGADLTEVELRRAKSRRAESRGAKAQRAKSCAAKSTQAASAAVLAIMDHFVEMLVCPEASAWARFIVREQMEPTEAFDILYDTVMGPVGDYLCSLIVRIGQGRCDDAEARLKTMAIVGQALAFRYCRATLLRMTGWTEVDADDAARIGRIIRAHTSAILASI
jgi:AcrR family transcriptional regulator